MGNDEMVTANRKGWHEWQYNNGNNNSGNMGWQGIGYKAEGWHGWRRHWGGKKENSNNGGC